MHAEVYHQLREHFHHMSLGYPATANGAELNLLERLFTEQEARIALGVRPQLESAPEIAARLGADANKLESFLDRMSFQGLIYREGDRGSRRYGLLTYTGGGRGSLAKFQMKGLRKNREHAEDDDTFFPILWREVAVSRTNPRQITPVERHLPVNVEASPWERASEIVGQSNMICLMDCGCRVGQKMVGKGCSQPIDDICLVYSPAADYCLENGLGRKITQEEALKAIRRGEDAGLVRITLNVQQHPTIMCQCCSCCCAWLRTIKLLDFLPESLPRSSYLTVVEKESCNGCEACVSICPMEALSMDKDEKVVVDTSRCIGCGVCISECPTDALSLNRKPEVSAPPATWDDLELAIAREKGRTYFYKV